MLYHETEEEVIARNERKLLRNFARLPQCTSKAALYNELGIVPVEEEIKKKKLIMFKRINDRRKTNNILKETMNMQCFKNFRWFQQISKIAVDYNVDLELMYLMDFKKWKMYIKKKS